jgi:uncharacterized protein (UPF0276 family)
VGVGLRAVHYAHILDREPAVDWFEIISDNYVHTEGRPLLYLDKIAERYPIVMHGVSLSIGSSDPLDFDYLRELVKLRDRVGARWVSDHLCWTGVAGRSSHDLLPLPYTEESLHHIAARVRMVQDFLQAPLALENPSTYLALQPSHLREWEFLSALAQETDCALLLDVNNIYVSAHNHGYDPEQYLANVPLDRVVQFHVAGHSQRGDYLIDTHIGPVSDPVWRLLAQARALAPDVPVLLEWDAEIPDFETVHREALRSRELLSPASSHHPQQAAHP